MKLLIAILFCFALRAGAIVSLPFMQLNQFTNHNWIQLNSAPTLNPTNKSLTVEFFTRRDIGALGFFELRPIFAKGSIATNCNFSMFIDGSGNTFTMFTTNGTSASTQQGVFGGNPVGFTVANVWRSVAINHTFNTPSLMLSYITTNIVATNLFTTHNPARFTVSSWQIGSGNGTPNANSFPLFIGASQEVAINLVNWTSWAGPFTEIGIWNTSLTALQQLLLNTSRMKGIIKQVNPTNLVVYLPLDEGHDGQIITQTNYFLDRSGHQNHGSPIAGSGSPGITSHAESLFSYQPNE